MKVAIVEIGGSHDECMFTQIHALYREQIPVMIVTTSAVWERNPAWHPLVSEVFCVSVEGRMLADLRMWWKVRRTLLRWQATHVVCNTAQGGQIRNLTWILPRRLKMLGIIHTIRKFQGSFTQKLIHRRIRSYLLLSDFLRAKVDPPRGIEVGVFYPVLYPSGGMQVAKPTGECSIGVVGGVEFRRKDLEGLVEMLVQMPAHVRVYFLGKSDPSAPDVQRFVGWLTERNLRDKVVFFDAFLSQDELDASLKNMDFLCPLVHPNTPSAAQYISNQISGMFNLAYGYRIPLLIHEAYADIPDLQRAAAFYRVETFGDDLRRAQVQSAGLKTQMAETKKWDPAYQQSHYVSFIARS